MTDPCDQNLRARTNVRALRSERRGDRWFTSHETLAALPNKETLLMQLEASLCGTQNAPAGVEVLVVDVSERTGTTKFRSPYFRDEALVRIAGIFGAVVRRADTVYRIGDSRFAVTVVNACDSESSKSIAERIIAEVDGATTGPRQIRVSVGISSTPIEQISADDLLSQAESAALSSPQSFDDEWNVYSECLRAATPPSGVTIERLAQAVEREEFSLVFQAIIDSRDLTWCGAEALVRWNHPEHGTVLPGQFLPLAERSGMIGAIGRSVLPELGAFANSARDLSKRDDFFISLNVSHLQLGDAGYSNALRQTLAAAAFPLSNLVIEVTENFAPVEHDQMAAFSEILGSTDVRFALDDFGSGNWALDHLWRLPFSILKLDRRLIANIAESPDDRKLLEDLLAFAGEHNLCTIAEGVETAEQVAMLTGMGVDGMQGFKLSNPLTADESLGQITASAA
jgi:diguanylate cyclase (GGDEF)-like protein